MLQAGHFDVQCEDFTLPDISYGKKGQAAGLKINRAAILGNFPPRQCGLATFTRDMYSCLSQALPQARWDVIAMNDEGGVYDYPADVTRQLPQNDAAAYRKLADDLNANGTQVFFLQHEFGIYGGPAGAYVLECLERLTMPIETTLHTVLEKPNADQRRVMDSLSRLSSSLIVMSRKGAEILHRVYDVPQNKIAIIPHGAPFRPLQPTDEFKALLNLSGRKTLTTFGLLSPNKGIETVIAALPQIVRTCPDVMYLVVGATHPHLLRDEGEKYRDGLKAMAASLGVEKNIRFVNRFINDNDLVDILQATDVYVTPYLTESQITSGTLSYALALGRPIVSTPYWHAQEVLAGGVGALCPFHDTEAFALAISNLLASDEARSAMSMRAYMAGLSSRWSAVAQAYVARAESDLKRMPLPVPSRVRLPRQALTQITTAARSLETEPSWQMIERLSDDCGIFQHGKYRLPNRQHGYCADDNARALSFVTRHSQVTPPTERRIQLAYYYAAFLNHAWNDDAKFRNFMSYGRDWLDDGGSDDCSARCFEALVDTAVSDMPDDLVQWAVELGQRVLPKVHLWTSTRAQAVMIKSLSRAIDDIGIPQEVRPLITDAARALHRSYERHTGKDSAGKNHLWFEDKPTYDNGRLSEGLILAGHVLGDKTMLRDGVASLEWLMRQQTDAEQGHFVPIPTSSFCIDGQTHPLFDQQPLEVLATIEACLTAWRVTGDAIWKDEALRAFAWFHGSNSLGVTMITADGGCFDGLTPNGANENQGAESVLAYHQSWVALKAAL